MLARRDDGVTIEVFADGTWRYATANASQQSPGSFRRVPWGSPPAAAVKREGSAPATEVPDLLIWNDIDLAGLTWTVLYSYVDDALYSGRYHLATSFMNENRYLHEHDRIVELLGRKYGAPAESGDVWSNDLYRSNPDHWGLAVQDGHLARFAKWVNQSTEVSVWTTGADDSSSISIAFADQSRQSIVAQRYEDATLEDL